MSVTVYGRMNIPWASFITVVNAYNHSVEKFITHWKVYAPVGCNFSSARLATLLLSRQLQYRLRRQWLNKARGRWRLPRGPFRPPPSGPAGPATLCFTLFRFTTVAPPPHPLFKGKVIARVLVCWALILDLGLRCGLYQCLPDYTGFEGESIP